MLSVSKLLEGKPEGRSKTALARYGRSLKPVVVWNLTRACALSCVHCYNSSGPGEQPGELTDEEALRVMDGLSEAGVPAIIFSGGDPMMRPGILELMGYAAGKGMRAVLSTNGIAIDRKAAARIKAAGVSYVGVSLDGSAEVNDRLRGVNGAFNRALAGIRNCVDAGLTTGVRFTMSKKNAGELPFIFRLIEDEGVHRGYFSHLVYSGRGERFSSEDLSHGQTRAAVDLIFEAAGDFIRRDIRKDIVTGGNDADGVYLYLRLREKDPVKAEFVRSLLVSRGGNSSGVTLANIDNLGEVHADQFWSSRSFGSVREHAFGEIWADAPGALLGALRNRRRLVKGRCSRCVHFPMCAGNYRARAEYSTGDPWAEDPACYLTDKEIRVP